jgi:hypothetical protein
MICMRKLFALTSLLALHLTALCQTGPVLSIVNNWGTAELSWTGTFNISALQTTTNLSTPITWTDLSGAQGPGYFTLPITNQQQYFRFTPILPIFQFAIFYNMNLEIAAASTLNIRGPVLSNAGFWSGSTSITFSSTVSATGMVTNSANDPFCPGYSGSGGSTYTLPGQPTSPAPPLTMYGLNTYNNLSTAKAFLNLPPTNYILGTSGAFTPNGQLYLANKADLYVTNYPQGTNFGGSGSIPLGSPMAVYYGDANNPSNNFLTWVTNNFYVVSNVNQGISQIFSTNYVPIPANAAYYASSFQSTNGFKFTNNITSLRYTNHSSPELGTNYVLYMGYSFLTNVVFYDWREGWHNGSGPAKTVYAVQLDLQAFNNWLTNTAPNGGSNYNNQCEKISGKGHPIDSVYIYNAVPLTSTALPAVRVTNGKGLPSQDFIYGFTLATPMPLYVWGDYNATNISGSSLSQNNVTYTYPAALIADSVTVLSDNWLDANSKSGHSNSSGGPSASQTTINAACIEGIVQSTNNPASDANGYSGGAENYFRLLENWSSINFWYNGSMVAMFPCQYATNCWQQTGGYYTVPSRKWAYNTNFLNWDNLPPLTPTVVNYVTP